MIKREIITQIRKARASHIHWKSYMLLSVRGIVKDFKKTNFPIVQTECDFGKWYFDEVVNLAEFDSFQALEKPHEIIHDIYIQIYTLQNSNLRGGLFAKRINLLKSRQHEINNLIIDLNKQSNKLLDSLKQLENDVLRFTGDLTTLVDKDSDKELEKDISEE